MTDPGASHGLWLLVLVNSAVFILLAFSFFKLRVAPDWRRSVVPGLDRNCSAQRMEASNG